MLYRRCTINGVDYNHTPSELEKACSKPGVPAPPIMVNPQLMDDMIASYMCDMYTISAQRIQEFFLVLSICNTVIVSAVPHHDLMNASGMMETPKNRNKSMQSNGSNGIAKGISLHISFQLFFILIGFSLAISKQINTVRV